MRVQTLPSLARFGSSPPIHQKLEAFLAENGLGAEHGKSIQVGLTPEGALAVTVENAEDEAAVIVLLRDPRTLAISFKGIPVEVNRIYGLPSS